MHEPSAECRETHCYIHDEDEPDVPGDYRACGECFHVYRTATELLDEENKIMRSMGLPFTQDAAEVVTCPLCTHDF